MSFAMSYSKKTDLMKLRNFMIARMYIYNVIVSLCTFFLPRSNFDRSIVFISICHDLMAVH